MPLYSGRMVEIELYLKNRIYSVRSLNIKNPEAYDLAAAISRTTGESMTHVVTEALREYLERLQAHQNKASVQELLAIAKRASSQVKGPYLDHAAFLYDENGLPK